MQDHFALLVITHPFPFLAFKPFDTADQMTPQIIFKLVVVDKWVATYFAVNKNNKMMDYEDGCITISIPKYQIAH